MKRGVICFFVFLLCSFGVNAKEHVLIYTYHNKPPFIIDETKRQGLYYDLAQILTDESKDYQFELVYVPKKRLLRLLSYPEFNGVVLGVIPEWFSDQQEEKYHWLPGFFADQDEIISKASTPINYQNAKTLNNKIVALVAGHYYADLKWALSNQNTAKIETVGEQQVLQLIKNKRAELGFVRRSAYDYFLKHNLISASDYHVSMSPYAKFVRRAFVNRSRPLLYQELKSLLRKLKHDGTLALMATSYR